MYVTACHVFLEDSIVHLIIKSQNMSDFKTLIRTQTCFLLDDLFPGKGFQSQQWLLRKLSLQLTMMLHLMIVLPSLLSMAVVSMVTALGSWLLDIGANLHIVYDLTKFQSFNLLFLKMVPMD